MQNDKLLPCPFCEGEAELYERKHREYASTYYVRCKKCNVQTSPCVDESIVVEDWNTRKPMERIVEQLEEELKLADKEKERCARENPLQFDNAKGYATGIYNAIEIVKAGGVNNATN